MDFIFTSFCIAFPPLDFPALFSDRRKINSWNYSIYYVSPSKRISTVRRRAVRDSRRRRGNPLKLPLRPSGSGTSSGIFSMLRTNLTGNRHNASTWLTGQLLGSHHFYTSPCVRDNCVEEQQKGPTPHPHCPTADSQCYQRPLNVSRKGNPLAATIWARGSLIRVF